ncbi:MAG: GC-type dockerin domain-anchored protein [Phycisphaerales bacterium]
MPTALRSTVFTSLLLCLAAVTAHAQVTGLGAIGDSLTDEYIEESYGSYATNWTMQLVQHRAFNMGPTAATAGQPGGTWGETRRTGYKYNWARYGADSSDAIIDGQHTGLAAQVTSGLVSHTVLAVGANDFSPSTGAFFFLYWNFWSQSQIDSYVNGQIEDIRDAVEALDVAGANILLCNFIDFSVAPVTRGIYTSAARRDRVSAAVARVNQGVAAIARQHNCVLVDLNALGTAILGANTALHQFLNIGGVNIQLFNRDSTTHTNPLAGFVDDGAHPHTTLQGIFANTMMTALNVGWHTAYTPFSEQEILAHAGIAYIGPDALPAQLGPYNRFLRNFRCTADITTLGGNPGPDGVATVDDLVGYLQAFFAGNLSLADIASPGGAPTPDNQITVDDLVVYLAAFFTGCP